MNLSTTMTTFMLPILIYFFFENKLHNKESKKMPTLTINRYSLIIWMNEPQFNVMFEGHVHGSLISHGRYHETYSEMKIKDTYT